MKLFLNKSICQCTFRVSPGCKGSYPNPCNDMMKHSHDDDLIQRIYPQATPVQREAVMSGTCEECYNVVFSEVQNE